MMKRLSKYCVGARRLAFAGLLLAQYCPPLAQANPQGATVAAGSATFTSTGSQLSIHTSDRAFINWQSFNIGLGESTVFVQPSSSSVVWNRINDSNPSQILGSLSANGYVILQNQSGFYIGGQASISTGGLILTTSPSPPPDLFNSGAWQFDALPPSASIVNYGQINTSPGGSAFLIAMDIENHGSITAPGGNIGLYAGKEVLVSDRPDGRGLTAQVTLPAGSVDNSGKLIADAGTIALNAQVVNQGGLIQADSVREINGVIEIVAGDSLTLSASSDIEAKGDPQVTSAGGSVELRSGNTFQDAPTSVINVSGGAAGGNGGQVEISAPQLGAIQSQVRGGAASGWIGGQLSIDPLNIVLSSTSGSAATGSGGSTTVGVNDPPTTGTLTLKISSFSSFSQILLQASQDITLASSWNLGDSTDLNATLTLEAGRNILLNAGTSITAGKNWSLNLFAGADFTQPPGAVISGTGSLDLTGTATGAGTGTGTTAIQAQNGSLNVNAGQSIFVGKGNLQTTSGALTATAGQGVSITSGNLQTTTGALTVTVGQSVNITSGNLQTSSGALNVTAGQNVVLTSGAIRTTAGGSINVNAVAGSVDADANASVGNTAPTSLADMFSRR